MAPLPEFDLEKPKYDQNSFWGRIQFFQTSTSPAFFMASGAKLQNSLDLLGKFKMGQLEHEIELGKLSQQELNAKLWAARDVVDSAIHPDLDEPINPLFRFSAFVPINCLIIPFMLLPSTIASVPRTMAIHWGNQSYNAAVNYSNRNASNEQPMSRLMQGYFGACLTALGFSSLGTAATKRAHLFRPLVAKSLTMGLPYLAVAGAGCANLLLVRQNELTEGIDVCDVGTGETVGKSAVAGKTGLMQCCVARFAWNVPIMLCTPIISEQLYKIAPVLKSNQKANIITQVALTGVMLILAIPPALALYPQQVVMDVNTLEPQFQGLRNKEGYPITNVSFNKGL